MIGVIGDRIHTFCEIATLPTILKKNFRVEHFGVDLRGESGSPCAPLGPFFLRLRGGEALRAARAPGKLALSRWSGPAARCTSTSWRWLRRAGKSCVHGAPRSGSRRLEAEWLGRFDWWQAGGLDLDSQRCWRPCGRVVVELGHGAVQAVQRDGWQQQQRGSGGGGGEE